MNFSVVNHQLSVDHVKVTGVSGSSIFLVGDTDYVTLSSVFDTPPESLLIGPIVPLVRG